MTIWHIALNNLRQRKVRSILVMLGLAIGIAAMASIYALLQTMQTDMAEQMTDYGPNLLITADTGEITFSYGGITLPGVIVGTRQLTAGDAATVASLPDGALIQSMVPKLLVNATTYGQEVIIAGTDIQSEFAIKPWLRTVDYLARLEKMKQTSATPGEMAGVELVLEREAAEAVVLGDDEVILGAGVAYDLGLFPTNRLTIRDQEFVVKAVLEKNGTAEDDHIMMNLPRAQQLLGVADEITVIELAADLDAGSEKIFLEQLEAALPNAKVTALGKTGVDRGEIMERLSTFGYSVSAFILLAGILAASYGMSSSVVERTREIGIFRAIGLRRSFIQKIILLEGLLLSVTGGILGYIAGTLIARILIPLFSETALPVPWRWDALAASVVLALLVGLAASIYPARRAAGMDPSEALRLL